jgi:SAM-dependent methyltransferase
MSLRLRRQRHLTSDEIWHRSLATEVAFWDRWLATRAFNRPRAYRRRLDPDAPLNDPLLIAAVERSDGATVRILDVGAGPLTSIGARWPGKRLEIVPVDPLASSYRYLLAKRRLQPVVETICCHGESIDRRFAAGRFDIAYARDALDHTADPARVLGNMLNVVSAGGAIVLRHHLRSGLGAGYRGLRQWNFEVHNGELIVWSPRAMHNLSDALTDRASVRCEVQQSTREDQYVLALIRPTRADGDETSTTGSSVKSLQGR